jgi:hypothetical protein
MKNIKLGYLSALLIIGLGAVIFLVNSCQQVGVPADQMQTIDFKNQIIPIYSVNCGVCHNGGGDLGYNFNDSTDIKNSVVPYSLSQSKSYQAMISTFQIMPPNNPLSTSNRTIVMLWIEQGAKTH